MNNRKRPIVILIDLLGKKWVMRILWELYQEPCTFSELQKRCGVISPTIVNTRLKDLLEHNLVIKQDKVGYKLSEHGEELLKHFYPINEFAKRWAEGISTND